MARGVLTTAAYPERAPRDMTAPLARFSPHIDLTSTDVETIVRVLHDVTTAL